MNMRRTFARVAICMSEGAKRTRKGVVTLERIRETTEIEEQTRTKLSISVTR